MKFNSSKRSLKKNLALTLLFCIIIMEALLEQNEQVLINELDELIRFTYKLESELSVAINNAQK